ncbi:aminomethyl-transferring glycine dehydrogenase subunit GcvPB [Pararhodospirillum oryzae]|uniref:glycine dehydrogenase (aminomethyl-transferring) n=1 Tax=Pararhodospirillum oryzae TaxID=478448 RepID=A0A512H6C9_9PROT|nr:aminomethyl-transferring glycine dehydrogenase subunit GcvPB [Pararhodospirillum oryzae]GEO81016.1 glycine dehydrogenase (aminomethyl-transferring) [Pararhodospirillum oryzae]
MTATVSGHRGLDLEEPLLFELDTPGVSGIDEPEPEPGPTRLGGLEREGPIGLPGLSEPAVVRHYTRLSRRNYSIDAGMYPLGSCTMKYNPRLNERMARLPGFADLHPLQPEKTVQGALAVMAELGRWLCALTGLPAVALSPAAGAQGELCGLRAIRAALRERGELDTRRVVLVAESAHGTNPATAAACGFKVEAVPADARGRMDRAAFRARVGADVAAVMLTNPNTCGLFESDAPELARALHDAGGFVYMDGANLNALVGRVRAVDLGADAMHINLHKTFSTPHGGGGPGAGPTVLSAALAPFAPLPVLWQEEAGWRLIETMDGARARGLSPFGRLSGFHGQFGVFVRALAYLLAMGRDGLRQASGDAVLNANYILAGLSDVLSASYPGPCMHEALFDDRFLKDTGITTLDFAKAMIDEGFHPMTMYFPLVVHGALLIEPTETESRATLDQFIAVMRDLALRARAGDQAAFKAAPRLAPRRRLDETQAARHPVLRWAPPPSSGASSDESSFRTAPLSSNP